MKGRKTGGKVKGSKNKMTGAHRDLLDAWDKVSGPEKAKKLIKDALERASGYPVVEETLGPDGGILKRVLKQEYNFAPIASILPYIARRLDSTIELDSGSETVTIQFIRADAENKS